MIDLHCHLLPEIDDGSTSVSMSLEMARIAFDDGITDTVCTPHIYPWVYPNERLDICRRVDVLARQLQEAGLSLRITSGAEIQIVPDLLQGLRSGRMPTLNQGRYVLCEPPHFSVPHRFAELIEDLLISGYVPIIAHPERLTWLDEEHYDWFVDAAFAGAWIQVTADALTGRFGREARRWSERFLDDGLVHLIASDGHDDRHRLPTLSAGLRIAEQWIGAAEARRLVLDRPRSVLDNRDPLSVVPPPGLAEDDVINDDLIEDASRNLTSWE
ncbi:hypothetical protein CKO25_10415 [Thiocapsa imhoffii]|uniref:protein-tyrosine-phosphatase n=1 Tax=Thiocapsa imhoffii TaxID=382777 RepID=A0A9X0WI88_9GAMM|nr:CpsB/CapC family capsule biosynthesis tyrosine phosphatase [Thiocapsa imhoffii]MBK1645058.1 hypothetical protein [Thiocapsa imhoffii]